MTKTNQIAGQTAKIVTFSTNGGSQMVRITDPKLIEFIEDTKDLRDQYGHNPTHPMEYAEIAYQLYLARKIDRELYDHISNELCQLIDKFEYYPRAL